MKKMRKLLAASILSLMLVTPALAGDIMTGVISNPNNPPPNSTNQSATVNDPSVNTANSTEASAVDAVTEYVLTLINGALSVF